MIKLAEDRVMIEGFKDVIAINENEISFLYKGFKLSIEGVHLKVMSFNKHEMIIFGKIIALRFDYDEK